MLHTSYKNLEIEHSGEIVDELLGSGRLVGWS